MNIIFVLVPVTLVLVGIALWGFFWAVRSGQFEELEVASWEILVDDSSKAPAPTPTPPP